MPIIHLHCQSFYSQERETHTTKIRNQERAKVSNGKGTKSSGKEIVLARRRTEDNEGAKKKKKKEQTER